MALFVLVPSSFAGDAVVRCGLAKFAVKLQMPEREKVQLFKGDTKLDVESENWVFAMNRHGMAIVPEELSVVVGGSPKLEFRFENLRLCGDIEGVRVRVFDVSATDRSFLEESGCSCVKANK